MVLVPLLSAQFLVEPVIGVRLYFVSLPGCFSGFLTLWFSAKPLILMPRVGGKELTTMTARRLRHGHFLLLRENGIRIAELHKYKRNEMNNKDFLQTQKAGIIWVGKF